MSYDISRHHIFKKHYKDYTAIGDPMAVYLRQSSLFISKVKGIALPEAEAYVKEMMRKKGTQYPNIYQTYKDQTGDKLIKSNTLKAYLAEARENNRIIVPSLTTYVHHDEKESIHSKFLEYNKQRRKVYKKKMLKCEQLEDTTGALANMNMQMNMKITNNSMSGAGASNSTAMYNPSTHYTLTSTTRCLSSISNIVSESVLYSNKLFNTLDRALNYIVTIATEVDHQAVARVMTEHQLHYPTAEEVMDMMLYSTSVYWSNPKHEELILQSLRALDRDSLAAILYTNDLFSLRKYNDSYIRTLIQKLNTKKIDLITDPKEQIEAITTAPEGIQNLIHILFMEDIRGMNVEYDKLDPKLLNQMASTAHHIVETLYAYRTLFDMFFRTDFTPPGVCDFKEMVREAIVLSDTDSTCASFGAWSDWYFGEIRLDAEAMGVAGIIMTINTNILDHYIKLFCKNMNIPERHKDVLKMKNEFFWNVFIPTNKSKHYFASVEVKEGNVMREPFKKPEIKGVNLISIGSNVRIKKEFSEMVTSILKDLKLNYGKIAIKPYIDKTVELELFIKEAIEKGDISFFPTEQIKSPEGYKDPNSPSNKYYSHTLWNLSFGKYYGLADEPPYTVYKIGLTTSSKREFAEWLDSLENQELASAIKAALKQLNKTDVSLFRVPATICAKHGIPKEIYPIIDVKKIILEIMKAFYLVLESIGVYKSEEECLYESLVRKGVDDEKQ